MRVPTGQSPYVRVRRVLRRANINHPMKWGHFRDFWRALRIVWEP